MKVLFVISSLNTGGAQRALSNIITNLPDDWEIDILLNNTRDIVYPYRGNLIDLKIRELASRNNAFYQLKVLMKRYAALRKLKKNGRYKACVSFLDSANIANIITGNKYARTIISARLYFSHNNSVVFKFISPIIRLFYNRADCIVAVSEGVENDLAGNIGIRGDIVRTIVNGYPLEAIRSRAGQRQQTSGGCFTFITAGRCDQQKGQWHLIRAFHRFAMKYGNCRLVILGDGPFTGYYSGLLDGCNLSDKVILKGFVENPFAELVNADVFVFPSLWEGFPNAMVEAMACGLPVIASDFRSGAREILAPGTGIGFENKTGVELAEFGVIVPVCSGIRHPHNEPLEPQEMFLLEAMERLYCDEDIRRRYRAASERRAQDYSIENCVQQWRGLIEH